ncbi:Ankyrin repeat protein [Pleurostoma richardsiae]|uniref:Ankyrin repeat protein n=1 Tax=Pleurostoma richardsiae TaxID=41990 RepID=A0AA38RL60_9PEZI|nr:Ankyrin repeat protein [Pleurostoma richardsiae]
MAEIEPVPLYTETDSAQLFARVDQLKQSGMPAPFNFATPITNRIPRPSRPLGGEAPLTATEYAAHLDAWQLTRDIVASFFSSVVSKRDDLVTQFVSSGLVSPDVPSVEGETPLLAAVRAGDANMIRTLVTLGATVDGLGRSSLREHRGADRTPLQLAAALGKLALVRFLMEDCGADDAVVAPDGAIALRLAAAGGHREVVAYLPARRAGAWRRWKTAHEREMAVVRRAVRGITRYLSIIVWHIPKFFVYDTPKELGTRAWKRRLDFARWCKRTVVELPSRLKSVGRKAWEGAKKAPGQIWKGVKKIPGLVKKFLLVLRRGIMAIPKTLHIIWEWISSGAKKTWHALAEAALRAASFIHTVLSAVVSFFRSITLKDVWDGFCGLFRAVFIGIPEAVWSFLVRFSQVSYKVLKALFGTLGIALWYLALAIWWVVMFIPNKLWDVIMALSSSISSAVHELMVWLDPKRV